MRRKGFLCGCGEVIVASHRNTAIPHTTFYQPVHAIVSHKCRLTIRSIFLRQSLHDHWFGTEQSSGCRYTPSRCVSTERIVLSTKGNERMMA